MAKSGVSLNWGGFDKAINGLASRPARAKTALMAEIGDALVSGTIKRFADGEDPEGHKWEPSGRAWTEGVDDGGYGKTLVDTGRLRNSIDYVTSPDSVTVGSNVEYARIHQMGGKAGRGRKVTIPARPYLGVSRADMEEVQGILSDFLAEPFKGAK